MYTKKTFTNIKTGVSITDVSDYFGTCTIAFCFCTLTIIYKKYKTNQDDKISHTRSINEEPINNFKSNLEQMDITSILSQRDTNKEYK